MVKSMEWDIFKNSGERPVTTAQLVKKLNSNTKINSSNPA